MKLVPYKNEGKAAFEQQVGEDMVKCEPGATVMLPESLANLLRPAHMVVVAASASADVVTSAEAPAPAMEDSGVRKRKG